MLVIVKSPRNFIEKSFARDADGAPSIRFHASGTQVDVTGDKVTDQLLDSMVRQAKAGTVRLIDNHKETFPLGWSYDAEIVQSDLGTRELYVDFWLDVEHPLYKLVMKYINAGWDPQCSIGLLDNGGKNRVEQVDPETGKKVGMLLDAPFDHLAFTPPGGAAYKPAGVDAVDTIIAKSLSEAASVLQSAVTKSDERKPAMMTKEQLNAKIKEAADSRAGRTDALKAKRADALEMAKEAAAHNAGLAQLAKDVGEMTDLAPEDMKAYINHLAMENTVIAEALADLNADVAEGGETPAAAAPAGAPPEKGAGDEDHAGGLKCMKEAAAQAGRFKAYMEAEATKPKEGEAEADVFKRFKEAEAASPPSTDAALADRPAGEAQPVIAPIVPASDATPAATPDKPIAKEDAPVAAPVEAEAGKIFKSLNAIIEKQTAQLAQQGATIETLSSRVVAVEKTANTAAAPLRFMPGDGVTDDQAAENVAGVFSHLDPMKRAVASQNAMAGGVREAFKPFIKQSVPR